ncbi:unnamed protein product [Choristocarpus tenellus]
MPMWYFNNGEEPVCSGGHYSRAWVVIPLKPCRNFMINYKMDETARRPRIEQPCMEQLTVYIPYFDSGTSQKDLLILFYFNFFILTFSNSPSKVDTLHMHVCFEAC